MSQSNRAAQFAPFAALTGYDASIHEAARLTQQKINLDDKAQVILNTKLNLIKKHIKKQPTITVIYFVPDAKKDGGIYVEYCGSIRLIDELERTLIFTDRTTIAIETILNIQCENFNNT